MKTTTQSSETPTLDTILSERYGVSLFDAPAITIEWAAEHLATIADRWTAGQVWRKAESKRHRRGIHTTTPDWHHPLFEAFFAKTREAYDVTEARRGQVA